MIAITTSSSISVKPGRFRVAFMDGAQLGDDTAGPVCYDRATSRHDRIRTPVIPDASFGYNAGGARHHHGATSRVRKPSPGPAHRPRVVAGGPGAAIGTVPRRRQRHRDRPADPIG